MNPQVGKNTDASEPLSVVDALRAYARAVNTLRADPLEPYLADDFVYESQMVFGALVGKEAFLDYFRGKLESIRSTGYRTYAEMGRLPAPYPDRFCVVVAQKSRDNLVATVLVEVKDAKIARIDMCVVPPPFAAFRTGEYPT